MQDLQTGKISNQLILMSHIAGLFYQLYVNGLQGIFAGVCGSIFSIILLFPIFTIHGLGAGDIKLIAVVSCFLSIVQYRTILIFIVVSIFAGALQSILQRLIHHKFQRTIHFSIPILVSAILHMGGVY